MLYAIKLQDIVIPRLYAFMYRWCCTIGLCPDGSVQSVIARAGRNESREPYAASLGNRLDQAALQCAYGFDVAEKDIALICNFEA